MPESGNLFRKHQEFTRKRTFANNSVLSVLLYPTQDGFGLRFVDVYKVRGSSARISADLVLNLVRLELRLASGLIQPV